MGLMPDAYFGPVIIMVVCCAVFTPIALKIAFRVKPSLHAIPETEPSSPLVDRYELTAKLDDMIDEDARKLFFKEEQETPKTESTKNKK